MSGPSSAYRFDIIKLDTICTYEQWFCGVFELIQMSSARPGGNASGAA